MSTPVEPYRGIAEWAAHQEDLVLLQLEICAAREHAGTPIDQAHLARALQDPTDLRRAIRALRGLGQQSAAAELVYELSQLQTLVAERARAMSPRAPLDQLAERLSLAPIEVDLLRLRWVLQTSPTAMAVARAHGLEPHQTHVGVDFVTRVLTTRTVDRLTIRRALDEDATLVRCRLLDLAVDHGLWSRVRVPPVVVTWLSGRVVPSSSAYAVRAAPAPPVVPQALVPEATWSRLDAALQGDAVRTLIVAPPGAGVPALLDGVAAATGRGVVALDLTPRNDRRASVADLLEQAARDALLTHALLVLTAPARVDDKDLPELELLAARLWELPVPIVLRADRITPAVQRLSTSFVRIDLPELEVADLARLWIAASPGGTKGPAGRAEPILREVLRDHRLTPAAVLLAAPDAASRADQAGRAELAADDVLAASATQAESDLGTLATRLTTTFALDDLIVPDETRDQLREILNSAAHRQRVMEAWGFAPKYPYGSCLSVLFSGPSGTGKTMAASILAQTLARPLYRVDLSQIFDRYVGETEKNLSKVFDGAQAGHAIILFDEADALFSKRTEVKSSNDRYANLEVNYLLQRIEHHHGIVILTTNLDSSIDEAFRRRIRFTVRFPMPDVDTRARLWRSMIPTQAELDRKVDFGELGYAYDLPGGGIKNAVLRAAFLAAGEGNPIGMSHLERAARAECAALGKLVRAR
ncbi:MAG: ATP-binding protein [Deltaproteobacteria bacterium]|nr:ATP-binding protein [Deltaproteobacteria bacterium]